MAKYEARGKVQRKFYITEALADTLRIEAAKRNESQSAIAERALRKELGLMEVTAALTGSRDEFAAAMGFADYETLIAASELVVTEGDADWFITQLPDGRWAAWDDAELALDRVAYFDTREEAEAFHLDAYAEKYGK